MYSSETNRRISQGMPTRLLAVAFGLLCVTLGMITWTMYDTFMDLERFNAQAMRLSDYGVAIVRAFDKSVIFAGRGALSGDTTVMQRHQDYENEVKRLFHESMILAPEVRETPATAEAELAGKKLEDIVDRAFALVREDKRLEAGALIFSAEAEAAEDNYVATLNVALDDVREMLNQDVRTDKIQGWITVGVTILASGMCGFTWVVLWLRMRRSHEQLSMAVLELRTTNEDLDIARAAAQKANEAKTRLVSHMSHELRTPLNAILGFVQILQKGELNPRQRECVELTLSASLRLFKLVDVVLELIRIESGQGEFCVESFNPKELLAQAVQLAVATGARKNVEFVVEESGCDARIEADRQELQQVLVRLVVEAAGRSGQNGHVKLSCRQPTPGYLRINVSDDGPGIDQRDLETVFSPFAPHGDHQTGAKGAGLGLAVSKTIIEAMKGAMGVESKLGEGADFWVEFPKVKSI
ncbi:hypothetical protein BH09SUM1_BH09SUM1_14770 [soil metagenome]